MSQCTILPKIKIAILLLLKWCFLQFDTVFNENCLLLLSSWGLCQNFMKSYHFLTPISKIYFKISYNTTFYNPKDLGTKIVSCCMWPKILKKLLFYHWFHKAFIKNYEKPIIFKNKLNKFISTSLYCKILGS